MRDAVLKNSMIVIGDSDVVTSCLIASIDPPSGHMRFSAVLMSLLRLTPSASPHLDDDGLMGMPMLFAMMSLNAISSVFSSSWKYASYASPHALVATMFCASALFSDSCSVGSSRVMRSAWPISFFSFVRIAEITVL